MEDKLEQSLIAQEINCSSILGEYFLGEKNLNNPKKIQYCLNLAQKFKFGKPKLSAEIFKYILSIDDKNYAAKINIIDCIKNIGGLPAAIKKLEEYEVEADPYFYVELSKKYSELKRFDKGIEYAKKAYESGTYTDGGLTFILRAAMQVADWDLSEKVIIKLNQYYKGANYKSVETPRTHLLWCDSLPLNIDVTKKFSHFLISKYENKSKEIKSFTGKNRKIRVGYISYDFRDHATSLLMLGLFRHHNKNLFDVYGYCLSYDDNSALRREVFSHFDKIFSLSKMSDSQAAELIQKHEIDILVDLNGLTEGVRYGIFSHRPAPIQLSYLAFPGSVGNRFIDYIIADPYTVRDDERSIYPEKVIRIPDTYQINDYRSRYLPPKSIVKPKELTGKYVLGMFNNINKVSREVWDTWMAILSKIPDAQLWILDPGTVEARTNLMSYVDKKNVLSSQIVFADKKKQYHHLARLQWCDIVLDPWPYGGHTTTSDALFAGLPVVAMEGKNFAARVSGGLLKSANLEKLIAKNKREYVDLAVNLLMSPNELNGIKMKLLAERMTMPIFDSVSRTRYIERAYFELVLRRSKNLPNIHLDINKAP